MSKYPRNSPWGAVQKYEELCNGVFQVSTADSGGIMVRYAASEFLSKEALKSGFKANNSFCFEEDCSSQVVLRELLDKNLWKIPDRITDKKQYEDGINQFLKIWHPEYWKARQKTLSAQNVNNDNVIDIRDIKDNKFVYNPQTSTLELCELNSEVSLQPYDVQTDRREIAERVQAPANQKPTLAERLEAGKEKAAARNNVREPSDTLRKIKNETEH